TIENELVFVPSGKLMATHIESEADLPLTETINAFYAFKTEVSNEFYGFFLDQIKDSDPTLYQQCLPKDENWLQERAPRELLNYSTHSRYANYPVVNISYAAAQAFCDWLTDCYANQPNSKNGKLKF